MPKDDKKASNAIKDNKDITEMIATGHPPEVEFKDFNEAWFKGPPPPQYIFPAKESEYVPKSERLLAIYDMLTDKSFPRKGAGKSTKPKILDAIIDAAIKIKLKIKEAYND